MAAIRATATLDAPASTVFDIVEDPERWPAYVPHVERALDVQRSDRRVGDSFRLIYKVMGVSFDETLTVTDYERPRLYSMRVDGRMQGRQHWRLNSHGGQTTVIVDVDYQLPGGWFGRVLDALVLRRVNVKTIDRMFQNLRDLLR